jgi:hypothetical protein
MKEALVANSQPSSVRMFDVGMQLEKK